MIANSWDDFVAVAAHNWLAGFAIICTHVALVALAILVLFILVDCVRVAIDNAVWFLRAMREWIGSIRSKRKR